MCVVKDGKRPASNIAMVEASGRGARMDTNGKLEVYGTYARREILEFYAVYFVG